MTTVTVGTVVAAPVERVFDVFTDVEHGPERVSNIQKIEMLTVGGVKLGSRWLETREVLGHPDSAEMDSDGVRAKPHVYHHSSESRRTDRCGVHIRACQRCTRVEIEFILGSQGCHLGRWPRAVGDCQQGARDVLGHDLDDLKTFIEQRPA
jgi:hypothetical protein